MRKARPKKSEARTKTRGTSVRVVGTTTRVQLDEEMTKRLEIIAEALSLTSAEALRRVIEVGLPLQEEKHAARLKPGKA